MQNLISKFQEFLPSLIKGTQYTIEITVLGIILSTIFGFVFSQALLSKRKLINKPVRILINVIRGTPLLVQMFYVYFVLPDLGITLGALEAAVLSLSICYGAYHAEIFRAGIMSIPVGQWEAATSLGLKHYQILGRIVLPQAARIILPPLGTSCIILLKDSSLASVITVRELTRSGQLIASTTFENLTVYSMVALIYILLTQLLALLVHSMERKYRLK
jgi:polar amino acid transport system permease protein